MSVVQRSWHWDHILKPSETHHPCTFPCDSQAKAAPPVSFDAQFYYCHRLRCGLLWESSSGWHSLSKRISAGKLMQMLINFDWQRVETQAECVRAPQTQSHLCGLCRCEAKMSCVSTQRRCILKTQTRRAPRAQTRAQTTENPSVSDKQNGCVPFGSPGKWKLLTEQLAS